MTVSSRARIESKKTLDSRTISRILRTVSCHEGFYFFRGLKDPIGKIACSLTEFIEELKTVDIHSITFHFIRKDFERWIRNVFGDEELSRRISRITTKDENLRNGIIQIVKKRMIELENIVST